ncbi:uncharacterized protein LOC144500996 isoform X2 [Mustelus asterias]
MANSVLARPEAATLPIYTELAALTQGEQQQGCEGEEEEDMLWGGDVNGQPGYPSTPASSSPWQQNSEQAFTCRTQSSGPQQDSHRQVIEHCEDTGIGPSESPSRPTEHCRPAPKLLDSGDEDSSQNVKKQRCSALPVTHRDSDPAPNRRSYWGDPSRLTLQCEPFPFPAVTTASLAHTGSRQPCSLTSFPVRPLQKANVPTPPASTSALPGDSLPAASDSSSSMKVMGLYAELVKELQEQVLELQRREWAQVEVVLLRDRRIEALERENQRLKDQLQKLEEENDLLSSDSERGITMRSLQAGALDTSRKSIKFLRDLVELLESNLETQANGRLKSELIPGSSVYLTNREMNELSHLPQDKPKLMTRKLLGYFFSDQTLARSSARGKRIAHNKTTMEKPICLPSVVTYAIKDYVTSVCGRGCDFTAVINSKCASSRRAVRKLTEKME